MISYNEEPFISSELHSQLKIVLVLGRVAMGNRTEMSSRRQGVLDFGKRNGLTLRESLGLSSPQNPSDAQSTRGLPQPPPLNAKLEWYR
jgi:hypothetical protein